MSSYFNYLSKYSSTFQISPVQKYKFVLHYPYFKLIWLASNGKGFKKSFATKMCKFFENHRLIFSIPVNGQEIRTAIKFQSDSVDSFREIFWGGEYEVKNAISDVKTFVDLGANLGLASLYFYTKFSPSRMLCVEGNPDLTTNLIEFKKQVKDKCEVIIENLCVTGNYNGKVSFFISPNNRDSKVMFEECADATLSLDGASFRNLLDKHQFNEIDLLKMDIEGGEYDILTKDGEIFKRCRDILAEVHGSNDDRKSFRDKLEAIGFKLLETKSADAAGCEISHFRRI